MQDAIFLEPSLIDEKIKDDGINLNILNAKFQNYGKQLFQDYLDVNYTLPQYIQNTAELYSYNLPSELKQVFIPIKTAPYAWASELPIIYQFDELLKSGKRSNLDLYEQYDEVKKFFIKWVIESIEKEKAYYALSALNLIDKNVNRENFIKYILAGTIFTFDSKFRLPEKASEMYNKAENTIMELQIDEHAKSEFQYYINVFRGFNSYIGRNFEDANSHFTSALSKKANGVTALFYNSISKKHLNDLPQVLQNISDVIKYDLNRLNYVSNTNNLTLFSYILKNCVTYEIFKENEFSDVYSGIKTVVDSFCSQESSVIKTISERLISLKELKLDEHFDDHAKKEMEFLNDLFQSYKENKNVFIQMMLEGFLKKFENIIERIKSKIFEKANGEVASELFHFDISIKDDTELIGQLQKELESTKESNNKNMSLSIQSITKNYEDQIGYLQEKLNKLETTKEYDAASSFNNNMVYNLIVSLIVFLIGGLIGGSDGKVEASFRNSEFVSSLIVNGIKWGGIIFFLGIIVSFISYLSTIVERANQKQKLIKRISILKSQKETAIEETKNEFVKRQKSLEDSIKQKIEDTIKRIENLKIEKAKKEISLREEVFKTFEDKLKSLNSI
jgi:hypothetical protein